MIILEQNVVYGAQMIAYHKIGRCVFEDKDFNFPVEYEGCIPIIAIAGYGKSILMNEIAIAESKYKDYILIFDYAGEHIMLKYPNMLSFHPDCIEGLTIIENFGFTISDFIKPVYWMSLGFPEKASDKLSQLARQVEKHRDDPDLFLEMIEHMSIGAEIHKESYYSILRNFKGRIFIDPNDENDTRIHIKDWGRYILQKKKVLINLDLSHADNELAKCLVGVILSQIKKYIVDEIITPISIFIEEASMIAPSYTDKVPISCLLISELSQKLQKFKVRLFLVNQNLRDLHFSIIMNPQYYFLGRLSPLDNAMGNMTQGLRSSRPDNYREFVMTDGHNLQIKFVPDESPCLFRKRS